MRVLIVDDYEGNSTVLAKHVERCGHEAIVADNGFEALIQAARTPPDLVLMDIMMPGMDGYETAKRLRSDLGQTAPIYAISAFERNSTLLRDAGMAGHYRKPLEFSELRELLGC
jgi:CheY-like chemotaxis protein